MGYFANGTEGEMYAEKYCIRCIHTDDCDVWDAHMLIPINKETTFCDKCRMFIEKKEVK